jgi:hypothetical protein
MPEVVGLEGRVSACPSREVRRKRTSKLTLINVPRSMWDKAEIVAIIGAACSRAAANRRTVHSRGFGLEGRVSACPSREVRRKRTSKLTLIGSSSMAVDLWHRIKGIALVDHNVPRSMWDKAEIVAIIGAALEGRVSACPSREVRRKRTSKLTLIGSSSMAVDAVHL